VTPRRQAAACSSLEDRFEERWSEISHIVPGLQKDDALDSVQIVVERDLTLANLAPKAKVRDQFLAVEVEAQHLCLAIDALDPISRWRLGVDHLRSELARVRSECRKLAPQVNLKRSGGGRVRRTERALKNSAAALALDFITRPGSGFTGKLTLARGSDWIGLATILAQIFLGREDVGDVYRACSRLRHIRDAPTAPAA
jgi:hypothetical protein